MGTVRFSVVAGSGLVVVLAFVAALGCSPTKTTEQNALTLIGKAAGIFGCRGCTEEPDLEDAAEELIETFDVADADNDRRLSLQEAQEAIAGLTSEQFNLLDLDNDGFLDESELRGVIEQQPSEGEPTENEGEPTEAEGESAEGEIAQGKEVTVMLPGDVPLVLVRIPAGTFMMGRYADEQDSDDNEDPQHQVTLAQDFYLGKYEITQQQWLAIMGSWPDDEDFPTVEYGVGNTYPAYFVSWNHARNFIGNLNGHITSTGQGPATFRLPSEAEWEYACRAGTTTRFYWGDDPDYSQIDGYAWYYGNNVPNGPKPVGGKLPNAFGLYDMSGNVWEWCEDDWHDDYTGAPTNGNAWADSPRGSGRLVRGGGWGSYGNYCRSAGRDYYGNPSYTNYFVGFRLAR